MSADPAAGLHLPCMYCQDHHPERYLCDAVKAYVDATRAAAAANEVPTMAFDRPVHGMLADDDPTTVLMSQFMAYGGVVPGHAGVVFPVLVLTGRDAQQQPLPRWVYAGDSAELRRAVQLVDDMVNLAVRTAVAENRKNKT